MRNKTNAIVVTAPVRLDNGQNHNKGRVVVRLTISQDFQGVSVQEGEPVNVYCQNEKCGARLFDFHGEGTYSDGAVLCPKCDYAYPIHPVARKKQSTKKPEPKPVTTFQPRRQNKPWSRKATA